MTHPYPPPGWRPRREPGESDQSAIDRYEDGLRDPDPEDAPRGWEP